MRFIVSFVTAKVLGFYMLEKVRQFPGFCLFAVALVFRVIFVMYVVTKAPQFILTDDSPRYDRLALNLVHRFQFCAKPFTMAELGLPDDYEVNVLTPGHLTDQEFFSGPEVKRVPLFPLVLGVFYLMFGYSPRLFLIVQAILGAITCWLLYRIGIRIGSKRIGLIAGTLLALNPRSVLHVAQIQVEAYFVLILTILVLSFLWFQQDATWPRALFLSFVLGWATLSREMGLYLVVFSLPALGYVWNKDERNRGRMFWGKAGVVVGVPLLVIGVWVLRNYSQYGRPIWTSHTLFSESWWFAPKIMASVWKISEEDARARILERVVEHHPEYQEDLRLLISDSEHFWKFNHRVEMNLHAVSITRKMMARHFPDTFLAFVSGGFWSMWAGVGEWRNLVISPQDYESLDIPRRTNDAKFALARLDITEFLEVTFSLLRVIPISVYLIFGYIWILTTILSLSAIWGVRPLWRLDFPLTITLVGLTMFAAFMSGPAGNNRLFAVAYPFLSLLSASGLNATLVARGRTSRS